MSYEIDTEEYKGFEIKICIDEISESPREWDNFGTMVCFHKRYNLGDKHDYRSEDYSGWNEVEETIRKDEDVAVLLPLYIYDHSGITISTTPFGCRWDSGQVGFIYVSKDSIRKEWGVKRITKNILGKAEKILLEEVRVYDDYIRGDVYGYEVKDEFGNIIDSCYGFYGDYSSEELRNDAKYIIDYEIIKRNEERALTTIQEIGD